MSRIVSRVGRVSVLVVLATGLAPVDAQENMFEGAFDPSRTIPSFSRPGITPPSTMSAPDADGSALQSEAPLLPPEPSQAASTATTISGAAVPQQRPDPVNIEEPSAPTIGPSGPLWTRREPEPAATRRLGRVEGSIQKRPRAQQSQVRPTRRLATKLTPRRQEAKSRPPRQTKLLSEARRTAPARIELAPRAGPQLPLVLMPRHARVGDGP
jgi:hypothetical protein